MQGKLHLIARVDKGPAPQAGTRLGYMKGQSTETRDVNVLLELQEPGDGVS